MAMFGLIGGTLAAGSGLLMLMTWLETSLQRSLAPDEQARPDLAPPGASSTPDEQPAQIAA